jgi:hypothetical protein
LKQISNEIGFGGMKGSSPPRLSGRSAFSEETFAGRCGNEKEAPIPAGGHLATIETA